METMYPHIQTGNSNEKSFSFHSHIDLQMVKDSLMKQTLRPTSTQIFECFQKGPPRLIPDQNKTNSFRQQKELSLEKFRGELNTKRSYKQDTAQENAPGRFEEIPGIYFSYNVETDSIIKPEALTLVPERGSNKDTYLQSTHKETGHGSASEHVRVPQDSTVSAVFSPVQRDTNTVGIQSQQAWCREGECASYLPSLPASLCLESRPPPACELVNISDVKVLFDIADLPSLQKNPLPQLTRRASKDSGSSQERMLHESVSESQNFISNLSFIDQGGDLTTCYHIPNIQLVGEPTDVDMNQQNTPSVKTNRCISEDGHIISRKKTREEKLEYLRKYAKDRRAKETPEQRETRLADLRNRQRARKAKETAEQRIKRLEKDREKTLRYRAKKKHEVKCDKDNTPRKIDNYGQNSGTSSTI